MSTLHSSCNTRFGLLFVFLQGLLVSGVALVGDSIVPGGSSAAAESKKTAFYRPPRRGAPATRVAGGSRGTDSSTPDLFVVAPEHTGLTQQAHPVLYWYTSRPITAHFEFALINDNNFETLIETRLDVAPRAGIHRIPLEELNVSLQSGVPYQWSVAVVTDEKQRSGDIFASGTIERINPSGASLGTVNEERAVSRYAQAGLWYDAFNAASRLITKHPGEKRFIEQRAGLLEQVGLNEAALHEMQRSR